MTYFNATNEFAQNFNRAGRLLNKLSSQSLITEQYAEAVRAEREQLWQYLRVLGSTKTEQDVFLANAKLDSIILDLIKKGNNE
jgi:hypothetical protein